MLPLTVKGTDLNVAFAVPQGLSPGPGQAPALWDIKLCLVVVAVSSGPLTAVTKVPGTRQSVTKD